MVILGVAPFFILSIMLQRNVECLNDPIVETTGNIQEHESDFNKDLILVPDLNCTNETLRTRDYEIYPNSTLYVKKYDLFLNSSSYAQKDDKITICKPPWISVMDKLTVALYFSIIIFMIHAQIPMVFSLGHFARLILTIVWYIPTALLFSVYLYSGYSDFIDKCGMAMSVVAFINSSTLGWMCLLTNSHILKFLEKRRCIEIIDNAIILKNVSSILHLALFVATIVSVPSFIMTLFVYGVGFNDRIEGDIMLMYFGPPLMFFVIINFVFHTPSRAVFENRSETVIVFLRKIGFDHYKYVLFYFSCNILWLIGCIAIHINYWVAWYCFVLANLMLPIYYVNEVMSLDYLFYEFLEEDEGYAVHYKWGKLIFKIDFDYKVTESES